jgi:hypothetical protein
VQYKSVPQRLKPIVFGTVYGTAEPVPFVQRRFSIRLFAVAREPTVSTEWAMAGAKVLICYCEGGTAEAAVPFVQSFCAACEARRLSVQQLN